jgi:3-hydroxyacyl-CoA dehydrogenase
MGNARGSVIGVISFAAQKVPIQSVSWMRSGGRDTMSDSPVRIETRDRVAFILIHHPPANALSFGVRQGLANALSSALEDPDADSIVIACEGATFFAGADIREFGHPPQKPLLTELANQCESAEKPIVAAIHGSALGGGLEIALACHARVAAPDARVGLPEVKLGIIPGAGGTQRLPRLIGAVPALEMITDGKTMSADDALLMGLIDRIARGDLRQEAGEFARGLIGVPLRRTGRLAIPRHDDDRFGAATARVSSNARGRIAPIKAAEAVAYALNHELTGGLQREREIFLELVDSPQAKALRHVFFGEREVLKQKPQASPNAIQRPVVIGAGTMGAGITAALLTAGFEVDVIEQDAAIGAGWDRISGIFSRQVATSRITQKERDGHLSRLRMSSSWDPVGLSDFILEAAFEDMAVKRSIFAKLGSRAPPNTILATNTSYLDVDEIASASGRSAAVLGMHFFSPAHKMRLVEVAAARNSTATAIATAVALAKRLGKLPIVCRACEGFVGNRIFSQYRALSELMVEDGALPQDVDAALEEFGFPMGVFAVSDLAGLDIGLARRNQTAARRNPLARYPSTVADRLCALRRLGQKTGAGWYAYGGGKRAVDPAVTALVLDVSKQHKITRQPIAAPMMQRHLRAIMVNEGAKILAESVVSRAFDIDLVMIHGYGYPAWRGGPMFEADAIGLDVVLADVGAIYAQAGIGFEPAPLLVELARRGEPFAQLRPVGGMNGG